MIKLNWYGKVLAGIALFFLFEIISTQYNSESYQRMLRENGIRQSMSRAGCPYDNACSESFFATAKKECIYLKNYATIDEVKADVFEYIELFYNRKRMHSYSGDNDL